MIVAIACFSTSSTKIAGQKGILGFWNNVSSLSFVGRINKKEKASIMANPDSEV